MNFKKFFLDELLYSFRPDVWSILSDNEKDDKINELINASFKNLGLTNEKYNGWYFGQNMSADSIAEYSKQIDGNYKIALFRFCKT